MKTWQNGLGFNQDVAKKCGSKWELGKMDRALIRIWQISVGLKWELGKMDRALIRMWQKKVWVLMRTWQKCEGLIRNYAVS